MSLAIKQYLETIFTLITTIFAIDLVPIVFMFHLDYAMKYTVFDMADSIQCIGNVTR